MTQNTFKKCSENASKKVQNSKIFPPRVRGHPFPQTPSPTDFVLVTIPIFFYVLCIYYQRNKCFENASKNIQNSKIFLPRGKGTHLQTLSPTEFFLSQSLYIFIKKIIRYLFIIKCHKILLKSALKMHLRSSKIQKFFY